MDLLPDEIFLHLLNFLSWKDILRLSQVNENTLRLCYENSTWSVILQRKRVKDLQLQSSRSKLIHPGEVADYADSDLFQQHLSASIQPVASYQAQFLVEMLCDKIAARVLECAQMLLRSQRVESVYRVALYQARSLVVEPDLQIDERVFQYRLGMLNNVYASRPGGNKMMVQQLVAKLMRVCSSLPFLASIFLFVYLCFPVWLFSTLQSIAHL
jgi:hypothetical protein